MHGDFLSLYWVMNTYYCFYDCIKTLLDNEMFLNEVYLLDIITLTNNLISKLLVINYNT